MWKCLGDVDPVNQTSSRKLSQVHSSPRFIVRRPRGVAPVPYLRLSHLYICYKLSHLYTRYKLSHLALRHSLKCLTECLSQTLFYSIHYPVSYGSVVWRIGIGTEMWSCRKRMRWLSNDALPLSSRSSPAATLTPSHTSK